MGKKQRKKYETTIRVRPLETPDFDFFLESLFMSKKNIFLPKLACTFLNEMKKHKDIEFFERYKWIDFCKKNNITKTTYYTMINKMIGVGIIEIKNKEYYVKSDRAEIFFDKLSISIKKNKRKKQEV
ncbi:MAG: hypothetical protein B6U87_01540 [Candidatus Aenigmarchaeota archaeon ex4484_52]|nr:MAG: hypothetical protein B6U87_01540 [Candidatus Aenigmarchaeota archaeon ex4484_52]